MVTVVIVAAALAIAALGSIAGVRGALALAGRRFRARGLIPVLVRARSRAGGLPRDWRRVGGLQPGPRGPVLSWSGRDYGPLRFPEQEMLKPDAGLRIGLGRRARIVRSVDIHGHSIEIGVPGAEVERVAAHLQRR